MTRSAEALAILRDGPDVTMARVWFDRHGLEPLTVLTRLRMGYALARALSEQEPADLVRITDGRDTIFAVEIGRTRDCVAVRVHGHAWRFGVANGKARDWRRAQRGWHIVGFGYPREREAAR